ncbi:MAG: sigma-70 family RNA polymerase sigma factor [Actinomycetota bacterium]
MAGASGHRGQSPEQRFRKLYRAHYSQVYAYFKRRTDTESAADGTVETFMVAWRRIDDVPDGDGALPWLYGVSRRTLANQRRGDRRAARLTERLAGLGSESEPTPEAVIVRGSEIQEVLDAYERLKESDQEVLRLAEWEELPHAEIAESLGISRTAVDQRIHRALGRLEKEVNRRRHMAMRRGGTP